MASAFTSIRSEEGNVVIDTENGREWYYMQRRNVGHIAAHEEEERSDRKGILDGKAAELSIQDAANMDWLQGVGYGAIGYGSTGASSSGSGMAMGAPAFVVVTEATMAKVQQAYDAMNSVVVGLKKNLLYLRGRVEGATISAAMAVAHGATEHISALQNVLFC